MGSSGDKVEIDIQRDDAHIEESHVTQNIVHVDNQLEHDLTVAQLLRRHPQVVWWCFYWAMAAVGWGFDAQINGAMISVASFRRDFGYTYRGKPVLRASWQTAFNTVSSAGQFFGGFFCSWIAERIGRKPALLVGLLVVTGGILGEVFSSAREAFVISKLVLGVGLGFYLTVAPLATSESSPVVLRGIATAGVNVGIGIGQLISNGILRAFGERDDHWAYRGPFAVQMFFVLFLAIGLPFAPESPWYLARKGKRREAMRSIVSLYGPGVNVQAKLEALEATVKEEEATKSRQGTMVQAFKGTDRIRTMISVGVFICQHLVGIIFVLGYSTYFFQLAGLEPSKSFDVGVGVTATGVFANVLSWFFINSFGRRRVFVIGTCSLTALLVLIGILDVVPTSTAKWAQAALTVVYAFVYFPSLGAMAFAILGEVSSTTMRAPTIALATAAQAAMGVLMNCAIPYMVNPDEGNLRGKVGFIFGGLGLVASVWSFLFVPELKGRTFGEVDLMFQNHVPPRKMGRYTIM